MSEGFQTSRMTRPSGRVKVWFFRHWPLLASIALFILLGGIYSRIMLPFEGPDEAEHFAYITWLAEGKGFPPHGDEAWHTPVKQESGQSPLYYLLASVPARLVDLTTPRATFRPNPYAFSMTWPRTVVDNDNRAIHYPEDGRPLIGGWLALYAARALTMVFGVILLIGVYGLAWEIFPDKPAIAYGGAMILALTPQVLFVGSMASNDIPAAAFSALSLWALAALVKRGPSFGRGLLLGAVYGLGILSKTSAAALALPIGAAFLWLALSKGYLLRKTFNAGIGLVLSTLATAGWWLFRSWRLYGSLLGLETHDQTPWAIDTPGELTKFSRRWLDVFRSYWLSLGWGTIRPPDWIYHLIELLALLALAGLLVAAWRWRRGSRPRPLTTIVLLGLLLLAIIGVAFSLELWMRRVVAPYGRLMFPAAAAVTVLLVTGWYTLHKKLPFVIAGVVGVVALVTPFWLARPVFALPKLLDEEAVAQLSPGLGWRFGPSAEEPVAELLSARAIKKSIILGEALPVELCWRVFAQTEEPYTILVHIIGPDNQLVANRRTFPGLGSYPTTIWQPGDVFCDQVNVNTWYSDNKTRVYWLEVAMLNEKMRQRVPAFDSQGNPIGATFVEQVQFISLDREEWQPEPADEGSDPFKLLAYTLPTTVQPGAEFDLALEWGVIQSVDQDYQVFVHFRDPLSGEPLSQADGPPLDGWYATSWWSAGEIVVDERTAVISADIPPGFYEVVVGFYDLATVQQIGKANSLGMIEVKVEPETGGE